MTRLASLLILAVVALRLLAEVVIRLGDRRACRWANRTEGQS